MMDIRIKTICSHPGWDFILRNRILIVVFLVALSMDTITTINFMRDTGPLVEIHPIVRSASVHFGIVAGPILGAIFKIISASILTVYFKYRTRWLFITASFLYVFAAIYNSQPPL